MTTFKSPPIPTKEMPTIYTMCRMMNEVQLFPCVPCFLFNNLQKDLLYIFFTPQLITSFAYMSKSILAKMHTDNKLRPRHHFKRIPEYPGSVTIYT